MNTLAAVFRDPAAALDVGSFVVPPLADGEILVDVDCCTICGSDLHTIRGDRPVGGPTILGHEIIGRVADTRADQPLDQLGNPIVIGDRITWSVVASCGKCFFCNNGLLQKCERLIKYGHETLDGPRPISGGLSQRCVLVPGTAIVRVPVELPDLVACPANCATATVAAAFRAAGSLARKCVVIHGAGMLGLTAAAMARHGEAEHVIVTDLSEQRCQRALQFGASRAIAAGDQAALCQAIADATAGRGADVVFEMAGSAEVIEASIDQLRVGGQLVLVGTVLPTRSVVISPEDIVRRMLCINGVHNYAPTDLERAIQFLLETHTQFPFHELVDAEYSLRDANQAVECALTGRAVRVAVRPD